MVRNGLTRSIGSLFSLKRIALIIALALLLRAAAVALHSEEILKGSYDQYTFFVLPALELVALLMAAVPLMISGVKRDRAERAGVTLLMVVISIAVLRIVDFARLPDPVTGRSSSDKRNSVRQYTDFGTSRIPQSVCLGWTTPAENAYAIP